MMTLRVTDIVASIWIKHPWKKIDACTIHSLDHLLTVGNKMSLMFSPEISPFLYFVFKLLIRRCAVLLYVIIFALLDLLIPEINDKKVKSFQDINLGPHH